MKPLIKVFFIISAVFLSTFVFIKLTGLLTIEHIEAWLIQAKQLSPLYVGLIVVLLLFADLFIAVPTLTVSILSGYFLGHTYGALAALTGVMLAGLCGYGLSRRYGESILGFLIKDPGERKTVIASFQQHGFVMILLSRALPIMPETTACLSGMTRMPFRKFILAWMISSVPYVLVASYGGSISSVDNPKPAIITAIGISVLLWLSGFLVSRFKRTQPR